MSLFRTLFRTPVLLLSASLLCGGAALAQDEADGEQREIEEKVEELVEAQAEKESEEGGEAADADPGEASYNVANCAPSEEGEGGSGESVAEVDPDVIEECEEMVK